MFCSGTICGTGAPVSRGPGEGHEGPALTQGTLDRVINELGRTWWNRNSFLDLNSQDPFCVALLSKMKKSNWQMSQDLPFLWESARCWTIRCGWAPVVSSISDRNVNLWCDPLNCFEPFAFPLSFGPKLSQDLGLHTSFDPPTWTSLIPPLPSLHQKTKPSYPLTVSSKNHYNASIYWEWKIWQKLRIFYRPS